MNEFINGNNTLGRFLSGAYYAIAITATIVGMIVWAVRQEGRINEIEREYIRINQRVDELDTRGTRASMLQITSIGLQLSALDARILLGLKALSDAQIGISSHLSNIEPEIRKIGVIDARQIEGFRRLDQLERHGTKGGFIEPMEGYSILPSRVFKFTKNGE